MFLWKKKQQTPVKGSWLKVDRREQDIFVHLSGRLDQTLKNDLCTALQSLLKHRIPGAIVLQLSNVHFMDAAVAATLAGFFKKAEQRHVPVEIWDASPAVKQVFAGLGIEELLNA